jgi:hypothetical protein
LVPPLSHPKQHGRIEESGCKMRPSNKRRKILKRMRSTIIVLIFLLFTAGGGQADSYQTEEGGSGGSLRWLEPPGLEGDERMRRSWIA